MQRDHVRAGQLHVLFDHRAALVSEASKGMETLAGSSLRKAFRDLQRVLHIGSLVDMRTTAGCSLIDYRRYQ